MLLFFKIMGLAWSDPDFSDPYFLEGLFEAVVGHA